MELTIVERKEKKKSHSKRLRAEGNIPCVLYAAGKENSPISIKAQDWDAIIRKISQGKLPTTVFTLTLEKKKKKAIVKDIQYDRTSYKVLHIDFEKIEDKRPVKVKVPITCIGGADCVGVKQGGVMRQVLRYMRVQCLAKDIPTEFFIEVQDLDIGQVKRLADISLPKRVKSLDILQEVAVVVGKR